jgi:hypothetical protein
MMLFQLQGSHYTDGVEQEMTNDGGLMPLGLGHTLLWNPRLFTPSFSK